MRSYSLAVVAVAVSLAQAVVQEVCCPRSAHSQALTQSLWVEVEQLEPVQELHQMAETLSSIPLLP